MQLFLGLVVFPQIGVLVRKVIEALHKLVKDSLLPVVGVQEAKEITSNDRVSLVVLLPLHPDVPEYLFHLLLVVLGGILPKLDDDRFEVIVDIVSLWQGSSAAERPFGVTSVHGAQT